MFPVPVKKLRPNAKIPTYGSEFAAGADLYACLDESVTIAPQTTAWIPTGIAMEIPVGYVGLVYARSGLACKRNLTLANTVGVIDSDYRGELTVVLRNQGTAPQTLEPGERVAQIVLTPYLTAQFMDADTLSDTVRGENGFGSTGTK